jgi:hypothetical protein
MWSDPRIGITVGMASIANGIVNGYLNEDDLVPDDVKDKRDIIGGKILARLEILANEILYVKGY